MQCSHKIVSDSKEISLERNNSSSGYMSEGEPPSAKEFDDVFPSFDWNVHLDKKLLSSSMSDCAENSASRKIPTVFRWNDDDDDDCQNVFLSGSFDNWKSRIPMARSESGFLTIVDIPEGTHQYKYFVDGHWKCLQNEPKVEDVSGFQNNLVTVKHSDFDVFKALDADAGIDESLSDQQWSQNIPQKDTGYNYLRARPPLLPPHLLATVLNQCMPSSCDPTMLLEPNHVILNHLYTLSIKNGVLVLGSTYRYRRKYITTLLYKPI